MSEVTPTRSAVMALKEERRAMQEGYVFLDEKCLLLASAMLRELRRYEAAMAAAQNQLAEAGDALAASVIRHGLEELQCHPEPAAAPLSLQLRRHSLMGVDLVDAKAAAESLDSDMPIFPSPETDRCRKTFAELLVRIATLAAMAGNLERLHREYRRSSRRVRALQDVLLPEVDRTLSDIENQLDELEQDEALGARWSRHRA